MNALRVRAIVVPIRFAPIFLGRLIVRVSRDSKGTRSRVVPILTNVLPVQIFAVNSALA
jgi:hypothetical protein